MQYPSTNTERPIDLHARIRRQSREIEALRSASRNTAVLLQTIGHELRNPLTPLQNSAHLLRKNASPSTVRLVARIVESQVAALRRLADDLKDAASAEVPPPLARVRVDLRDGLAESFLGFQQTATRKGVDLACALPSAPLCAEVDPLRLQQIVQNLLTNAIKYTPRGGEVKLRAAQEGMEIVIRVEDTGIGIGAEMMPHLFALFTRDDSAAQLDPDGLGVGLAVVKGLTALHGGTVKATSRGPGQGSEFTVRLPAARSPVNLRAGIDTQTPRFSFSRSLTSGGHANFEDSAVKRI